MAVETAKTSTLNDDFIKVAKKTAMTEESIHVMPSNITKDIISKAIKNLEIFVHSAKFG